MLKVKFILQTGLLIACGVSSLYSKEPTVPNSVPDSNVDVSTMVPAIPATPISLSEYVESVINRSLNALNTKSSFQGTTYSYKGTRRDLTAPRLSVTGSSSRTRSKAATSDAITDSASSSLSLSQPFLWGGDLSGTASGSTSRTYTDTLSNGALTSSATSFDRNSPSLSLSYRQALPIFIGIQRSRSWRKNNLGYRISTNSFDRDLQSIDLDARSLYYDALVSLAKTAVEKEKLKSSKILLSISKALVEAGKSAPVELTRAQISYKLDERRVRNAEVSTQQTLTSFKNLVLIPDDVPVELTSKMQYAPTKLSLKDLQEYALQRRLDFQNSKINVTLSEISLKESKETNRPVLSAGASYKIDAPTSLDRPETWEANASLSWSFFDSRINALRVKQQKISLENTKRQLELQRRGILVEVQNGYLELMRTDEQIADFSETRKQAEDNVAAVRLRYERGLDRLIDVFDAENKLRELDLEYLNLLVSFNKARDKLGFLIGTKIEEAFK